MFMPQWAGGLGLGVNSTQTTTNDWRPELPYYFINVPALKSFIGFDTFVENSRLRYCRLFGGY
jgi:hypothetical protein